MKDIRSIEELRQELEIDEFYEFGFRNATEHDMELIRSGRDYLDCSQDYFDGEPTGNMLSGTSAIYISEDMSDEELMHRYNHCKKYYEGNTILLLRDKQCGTGEDDYEALLGCDGWGSDVIAYVDL